jgi:hypothetical protein
VVNALSKSESGTEEKRWTNIKIESKVSTIGSDQENTWRHTPKTKKITETQQNNQQQRLGHGRRRVLTGVWWSKQSEADSIGMLGSRGEWWIDA